MRTKLENKERFGIHTFQAFWQYIIAHSALNYLTIKKINLYNGAASWTFAVRSASDSRELIQEASLVRANKQKKVTSSFDLHSETINMLWIKFFVRAIKNSQQVWNNCCESKCHATVQTMLDHRGDKHQASATPYIISRLKTRHSDKKPVSRQVIANPNWGAKRPGAGRVSVRSKNARRDEAQSEG